MCNYYDEILYSVQCMETGDCCLAERLTTTDGERGETPLLSSDQCDQCECNNTTNI